MSASPYAAPNTPIASSKRPRVAKGIKSPTPAKQGGGGLTTPTTPVNSEADLKHKGTQSAPAPTDDEKSSKALFSPIPRLDGESEGGSSSSSSSSGGGKAGESKVADEGLAPGAKLGEEKEQEGEEEAEEEEEEDVFNPYFFISGLPSYSTVGRNKVFLPPLPESGSGSTSRPTLALDLDETLVHCTVEPIEKPDLVFPVNFNGTLYDVYVRKRPYLDYFLETVSRSFEVIVFTASQKVYADVLLDLLDPEHKYVKHRLFREACLLVQGNYLKDLEVLGRDLQRTVLVDNSPHAYGYQIDNGIPIESWFDDDADTELLKLLGFLRQLFAADDVRPVVRDHFRTWELISNANKGIPVKLSAPPF